MRLRDMFELTECDPRPQDDTGVLKV